MGGHRVEGYAVRVVPYLCLLAVALAGCKSAPKDRPAPTANVSGGQAGTPFWADGNNSRNPAPAAISANATQGDPASLPGNDPEISGILAGKLVDNFGRAPGLAYVQVSLIRDGRADPIADVETVSQGHFYIRGLQPGRTYKLVARTKQEGRVLVGEVQARPPETRLLIPLSEELAGANTPPLPSAPDPPKARGASVRPADPPAVPPPAPPWNAPPAAGLGAPTGGATEFGPADQIAGGSSANPPRINIPPPATQIQPQSYAPAPSFPVSPPAGPACVVSGGRVITLRLPDADGRDWDYAQHRGRLVLIDFWGTWCGPCLRAVPEVSRLSATYAASGLEVIGVACERGSPAENARRVRDTRQRLGINYRLVLSNASNGGLVEQQFHVNALPTLVLLDANGTIVWRGSPEQMRELEGQIRRRLGY